MTKRKQWKKIRNRNCRLCGLWREAQAVCLIGRGSLNADIMLVGEAPGQREDDIGKPFQGRAGELLDYVIDALGLTRDELYITNICRCKPPGNRTPLAEEVIACSLYMQMELSLVDPKTVITLGVPASHALIPETRGKPMKSIHGQRYEVEGRTFIPTYHPSAYLHSQNDEIIDFIVNAFERALKYQDPPRKTHGYLIRTPTEAKAVCKMMTHDGPLVVDVETGGLDWIDPKIPLNLIGITDREEYGFSFVPSHAIRPFIRELLSERLLVNHNLKFDLKWLRREGYLPARYRVWCTLIALSLLDENNPKKDLESACLAYTDMEPWKIPIAEVIDPETPISRVALYNARDVDGSMRLYHTLCPLIKKEGLEKIFKHMMRVLRVIDWVEWKGMAIDLDVVEQLDDQLSQQIRKCKRQLMRVAKDIGFDLDLGSRNSILDMVFRRLRLPVVRRSPKTKQPSLNADAKEELAKVDDTGFIQTFMEWEKARKTHSTYVVSMPDYVRADGLLHPHYNLAKYQYAGKGKMKGTVTGRLTCTAPPIQTQPRKGPIKQMYVSRWEDGFLLDADYSQMELRVMCFESQDEAMMAAFQEGDVDLHREIAGLVFHKPSSLVTDDERKFTKAVNFGIIYAQTAYGLANNLKISQRRAQAFIDQWFERFPGVKKYMDRIERSIIQTHRAVTAMGRVRHLPGASRTNAHGRAKIREGINSRIQALASDICAFGMWLLYRELKQRQMESVVTANVYDSIIIDIPSREEARAVVQIANDLLVSPPIEEYYGWTFNVPLQVGLKIGKSWGKNMEIQ